MESPQTDTADATQADSTDAGTTDAGSTEAGSTDAGSTEAPSSNETLYMVLLYGDLDAWENSTPDEQAATFALHGQFVEQCAARGHTITGGAELTHSRLARTVRGLSVTQGPYAETAEQLGGFYLVSTADVDDLADVVRVLDDIVELRPCVPPPAE